MVVHLVSSKMLVRLYSRIFFLVKYCTQDYYIWLNKPNLIEFDIMCNCYNITSLLFINSLLLCSFCVSFYGSQPFCQTILSNWVSSLRCLPWLSLVDMMSARLTRHVGFGFAGLLHYTHLEFNHCRLFEVGLYINTEGA